MLTDKLLKSLRRFEPDQVGTPWLAQVGSEPEDEALAEHRFLDDAIAVLFAAGQGVLVFVCHAKHLARNFLRVHRGNYR
jgi:hypothetical protein